MGSRSLRRRRTAASYLNIICSIMNRLTLFGLFAVTAMLVCYALEGLQPLVCPWLRLGLCTGFGLWISPGRLAFWGGRGDLVSRCLGPLAEKHPIVVSVRKESKVLKGGICMKQVAAIIKPSQLGDVQEALIKMGVEGMTVMEVKGFGRQKGHSDTLSWRGIYRRFSTQSQSSSPGHRCQGGTSGRRHRAGSAHGTNR